MNLPHNFQVSNFAMLFFLGVAIAGGGAIQHSSEELFEKYEFNNHVPSLPAEVLRAGCVSKKYRRKTQLVANFTGFTGVRCAEKLWQEIEGLALSPNESIYFC